MKFKVGDKVELVKHSGDTDNNLEIGYFGTVCMVSPGEQQPYCVRWYQYKRDPVWWVSKDVLAPHLNK